MPDNSSAEGSAFVEVTEADALWDGEMESFDVGDDEVLLLRVNGEIRAYDGICPHQSASLVEGDLEAGVLTCRVHEWQFDAATGVSINPQGSCLLRHDVRVTGDGMFEVRLRPRNKAAVHA
jgi:nitrite reductase/ring-hydroxylating ferredoxin subunit